jgi:hypothetical protein
MTLEGAHHRREGCDRHRSGDRTVGPAAGSVSTITWEDLVITLANERLEVELDPDRGAEIRAIRRPGGPNVLATYDWHTPLRASRPASSGDPTADWLSEYRGGWQELFPNAGAACEVMGVQLPFHGEVSTARWAMTDLESDSVTLSTATRLPLTLERRMRLAPDAATLLIEETVRLDADMAVPYRWGHHPAFAATEGAIVDVPEGIQVTVDDIWTGAHADLRQGSSGVWPRVATRSGGMVDLDRVGAGPTERLVYLSGFGVGGGWVAIRGVATSLGVAMAWDAATFPHAWFWWQIGGRSMPWYGRARIVAIEPHSAIREDGLAAAAARGEAHRLEPGQIHQTWLTVSLFDADSRPVRGVTRDGIVAR